MKVSYIYQVSNEGVVSRKNITSRDCEHCSSYKSFKSRIKQVATVSLIFLSMVTGEIFAGDKLPKSKASAGRKKEATFETISLSNALPDVVPSFPLPDLVPSNPPVPSAPPLIHLLLQQYSKAKDRIYANNKVRRLNNVIQNNTSLTHEFRVGSCIDIPKIFTPEQCD